MAIFNTPVNKGKIRLKRFAPGILVEDSCPTSKCKGKSNWNGVLMYPSWGVNTIPMECPVCKCKWTVDIELSITAKVAKKEKEESK